MTSSNGDIAAAFDHHPRTRLVFGAGAAGQLGDRARELGARRALLVTDPGIVAAGHIGPAHESLAQAGINVVQFDTVHTNPTTTDVDACLDVARANDIDLIIGFGGGSSMDTAKGCNFLLTNGGRMRDYWGVGKASKPMLPLVAVPTTAGTGSECQSFALIADARTHQKMACGDAKAAAAIAILDPELTLTQPRAVTVCTGVDALSHALETAVTARRNALSQMYSREAFRLIAGSFAAVLADGNDVAARGRMLLGAAFAGTAIENSMLGAAHSAANPLTAHYDVVHGHAVGVMLPHVMQFNAADPASAAAYTDLARLAHLCGPEAGDADAAARLIDFVRTALAQAGVPLTLEAHGVEPGMITTLASEAAGQWTAQFNPRRIAAEDFEMIYRAAYS